MERQKKPMSEEAAFNRLAALCATTEYCLADMRRKMEAWELPDGADLRILARLQREKYVDEARYARAFVRDKFRYNHWGARRIALELRRKGVDEAVAADALGEIGRDDTDDVLTALLRQKLKTTRGKTDYEVFMKLLRYSVGRGFSPDDAHRCLSRIIRMPEEEI